jgi:hypothetical protein
MFACAAVYRNRPQVGAGIQAWTVRMYTAGGIELSDGQRITLNAYVITVIDGGMKTLPSRGNGTKI